MVDASTVVIAGIVAYLLVRRRNQNLQQTIVVDKYKTEGNGRRARGWGLITGASGDNAVQYITADVSNHQGVRFRV
jgi:hypothetical protein